MTTITGKLQAADRSAIDGQEVRARLIAASSALAGGGEIVQQAVTVSGADGTWQLELTPTSDLAIPGGAYYAVTSGMEQWNINVPAEGSHPVGNVLIVPGPLPNTGVTAAAVQAKGDLLVATGPGVLTRHPVGDPGEYLAPDPSQPRGLRWLPLPAAGLVVYDGEGYAISPYPAPYVGLPRPTGAAVGSLHIRKALVVSGGGGGTDPEGEWGPQVASGVLASPTNVGYRGSLANLVDLHFNDPIPPEFGAAHWDSDGLYINGGAPVLEGYRIFASVTVGVDTIIRHCVINSPNGQFFVVAGNGTVTLTIEDSDLNGDGVLPLSVNGTNSEGYVRMRRCKVSGAADGVHFNFRGTSWETGSLISQVYITPTFLDADQHCDWFQGYSPAGVDGVGYCTIEYCTGPANLYGPLGNQINSSVICGSLPGEGTPYLRLTGNALTAGQYHIEIGPRVHLEATGNNFGYVDAGHAGSGLVSILPSAFVDVWTGNTNGDLVPIGPDGNPL